MRYKKIEGFSNLIKDDFSKAILNTNESEYKTYINSRLQKQNELEKIDKIQNEVDSIKNDINDIKNILNNILSKI